MKWIRMLLAVMVIALLLTLGTSVAIAGKPNGCTTIQDGTILTSTGGVVVLGYDEYGYNYQGHMFNGRYCDYDRVIGGSYCDVELIMKWSDEWLSNKDCNGDGTLDRHYGFPSYIGSGAWLTNHQRGRDENGDDWTYFVKIVAMPNEGYDCSPGYPIWGAFCVIQEVESGVGVTTLVNPAGFGTY